MTGNSVFRDQMKTLAEYPKSLRRFESEMHKGRFLDPNHGQPQIKEIMGRLEKRMTKQKLSENVEWSFDIPSDTPLVFKIKNNIQIELTQILVGTGLNIVKLNSEVRIWSNDRNIVFREDYDAECLRDKILKNNNSRVMMHFHLDKKHPDASNAEPLYHLQFGGYREEKKYHKVGYCWFPKIIDNLRLPFPPLDVILLSELILVNFFYRESYSLLNSPGWYKLVKISQDIFLKDYYDKCCKNLTSKNDTMLNKLMQ